MLTLDRFAKKNPPEINVLNKNARSKITVVFRTKTSPRLYRPVGGWGQSGSLQNWLGWGGVVSTSLS